MAEQMLKEYKRRMFDSIEERFSIYMPGRVKTTEIAGTLNWILRDKFEEYGLNPKFVGQYEIDEDNSRQTRVFAWQGTKACSPIKLEEGGVIWRAITTGKDQYVPDVTKDKDHIGCDSTMQGSELVLLSWSDPYLSVLHKPIIVPKGVLDIDLNVKGIFEQEDIERLRKIWDVYGKQIFPGIPTFVHQEPIAYKIAG